MQLIQIEGLVVGLILAIVSGVGYMIKRQLASNEKESDRRCTVDKRLSRLELQHDTIERHLARIENTLSQILTVLIQNRDDDV